MADGSGITIFDTLTPMLAVDATAQALEAFNDYADKIREFAQENAPWNDRTGAARAGLETDVSESMGDIILTLYHTVDYGLWLEVIQNGRFAIIMPTLEAFANEVFEAAGGRVIGEDL